MNEEKEKIMSSKDQLICLIKDAYYKGIDNTVEMSNLLSEAFDKNPTKVGSLILYLVDTKGLSMEDYIAKVIGSIVVKRNYLFHKTLIDKLISLKKWKIVVKYLNYGIDKRVAFYILLRIKNVINMTEQFNGKIYPSKDAQACAKFLPRKGTACNRIRGFMKLSPKQWRRKIVPMTKWYLPVMMSSNKWKYINYIKLPCHLIISYFNAFLRHDPDRFEAYINSCSTKEYIMQRACRKYFASVLNEEDINRLYPFVIQEYAKNERNEFTRKPFRKGPRNFTETNRSKNTNYKGFKSKSSFSRRYPKGY